MKKLLSLVLAAMLLMCLLSGCGGSKNTLVVASKQFTENIILAEMYAQLIEAKTDLKVERKLNLGGTSVIMPAMTAGDIDLYFEYTGTICNEILGLEDSGGDTAEEVLASAAAGMKEKQDMTFFTPVGLNNTFAVGVPKTVYDRLGITKLSELKEYAPELVFAAAHIFYTREADGYDALVDTYGLAFKSAEKMDQTLMYEASASGEVDVVVAYATDALLLKYDIVLLEDDLGLFPPYHGAPLCRNDTLKAHPELNEILDLLAGKIDDETMQGLNYQCDIEKKDVAVIAKEFLAAQGLA